MLLGSVAGQASEGMSESDAGEPGDASDGGYDGILAGDGLGGVTRYSWKFILGSMHGFEISSPETWIVLGASRQGRAVWIYAIRIW